MAGPLPKPTVTEEEDPDEWMTQTVNVLGTDCRDALISPLIKIQEQIMDEGTWINPILYTPPGIPHGMRRLHTDSARNAQNPCGIRTEYFFVVLFCSVL